MTGLFRFPRFTVVGALFLGLVVLADDSAGAISFQESTLAGLASQDRQHGQVRQLLAEGVNPNVPVNFGKTAVHEAAYAGAAQNLTALLEAGGDPHARDQDGNTPLHLASMGSLIGRYPAAIRALLNQGADLHRTNDAGETPLHVAVFNGVGSAGPAVVKTLLDAGARPKTVDGNGLTALQRFARHGEDMGGIVTLLIRSGADPNQKDPRGDAPLHAAIKGGGSNGKAEIVEALLAGGADPCVQDDRGYTPYHLADSRGMTRSRQALDRASGFDASHAGASGCKMGSEDASQMTDKGEGSAKEAVAALKPFGPNWIIVENQPCQKWNPIPVPGETYTWSGVCVDGKVSGQGRGVWHLPDGGRSVYEGSVREGKEHGQGTLNHSSGSRYEGEWRNGKRYGYGIATWPNGDRYEGEFREGKRHGHGTYTWPNGDRYEGEWRNNRRVD